MTTTTKIAITVVLVRTGGAAYWYFTKDATMERIKKLFTKLTDAEKTTLQKKVATLTDAERKTVNAILDQMLAKKLPTITMTVEEQTLMEVKLGISMKNYLPMTADELAIQPK